MWWVGGDSLGKRRIHLLFISVFAFLFLSGTALGSEIGPESVHGFAGFQPEEGLYGGW